MIKVFHEHEYFVTVFQIMNVNGDEMERECYVAIEPNPKINEFGPKVPNVMNYFGSLVM